MVKSKDGDGPAPETAPGFRESEQRAHLYIAIARDVAAAFNYLSSQLPVAGPLAGFARRIEDNVNAIYALIPAPPPPDEPQQGHS